MVVVEADDCCVTVDSGCCCCCAGWNLRTGCFSGEPTLALIRDGEDGRSTRVRFCLLVGDLSPGDIGASVEVEGAGRLTVLSSNFLRLGEPSALLGDASDGGAKSTLFTGAASVVSSNNTSDTSVLTCFFSGAARLSSRSSCLDLVRVCRKGRAGDDSAGGCC